jgi:hypothetical protein
VTRPGAALRPGALYFAACFCAGAVLGPIRVLVVEPAIGPAAAVLVEAPLILGVAVLAARAVLRGAPGASPLAVGLVALVLLVAAETVLAMALDRPRPLDPPRDAAAWIGLALKACFALVPALVARRA